jgi:uncharacterized cupredoxin-like copper-binding protein
MTAIDPGPVGVGSTSNRPRRVEEPLVVHLVGRPDGSRRMLRAVAIAASVGALATALCYGVAAVGDSSGGADVLGPGVVTVDIGIEMSTFDLGTLRVREGTVLELVVHNGDPIDHELIIGDAEVHARHAEGTERRHPPVAGEVSVAPGETAMTFYAFDEPGTVTYACHLPGHLAYGMVGQIEVVPS